VTPLRAANLDAIAALGVPIPHYDRKALIPRILHLGVGGFHRAHMALYTEEVAADGGDWGIRGIGLLERDRSMADVLAAQDYLYTLIERDTNGSNARIVGSIVDYTLAAGDDGAFARRVADPEVAILSLTITEGGYSLAAGNPTMEAIVAGLDARRSVGASPLTILSCDNVPGNGDTARGATMEIAEGHGAELVRYVEACAFPNSMVDRITPQTRDDDRLWLQDDLGIEDGWPVVCERFRQWVVEDRFASGRPRWENAGAVFSDRVHDWELYKLRMLNASHSALAYLMALAGVVYVDEAVALPHVRGFLERFLSDEVVPTLAAIPDYPPSEYAETVLQRFTNTGVRDQVARLCIDGTSKLRSFVIPTVEAQIERGGSLRCATLALAAWARYLATVPPAARAPDSHGESAVSLARRFLVEPSVFLELEEVFTPPLRGDSRFRAEFAAAAVDLAEYGSHGAINRVLT
jgi:mannitol 2-dehydrogenase